MHKQSNRLNQVFKTLQDGFFSGTFNVYKQAQKFHKSLLHEKVTLKGAETARGLRVLSTLAEEKLEAKELLEDKKSIVSDKPTVSNDANIEFEALDNKSSARIKETKQAVLESKVKDKKESESSEEGNVNKTSLGDKGKQKHTKSLKQKEDKKSTEKTGLAKETLYSRGQLGLLLILLPTWTFYAIAENLETSGNEKQAKQVFGLGTLLNIIPLLLVFHGFYIGSVGFMLFGLLVAWFINFAFVLGFIKKHKELQQDEKYGSKGIREIIGLLAVGIVFNIIEFIVVGILYAIINKIIIYFV